MAGEWPTVTVDKAPLEVIDGDRGVNYPTQTEFSRDGHCLFLNAGNVRPTGFDFSDCAFITAARDGLLRKGKLLRDDIVLTTRGTVGNSAYFDSHIPFEHVRINSGMVILRAQGPFLHSRYLYIFVRSALFESQVSALRTGSAQPQLPIRDINRIKIPLPPPSAQLAIAQVIGSLDDKIELNRRTAETLEAMARAVFKSWFVDFDPVHAKVEGRPSGLSEDIAALFPCSFDEDGQPTGWQRSKILKLCESIYSGGTPSTTEPAFWGGSFPWLSSGETRSHFVIDTEKRITKDGIDGSSTRLAKAMSTVIASAGQGHTRGQTSMLAIDTYINQSIIALKANTKVCSDRFLYFDLERRYEEFRQLSDGQSSRGSLTTKMLAAVDTLLPPTELVSAFDNFVKPLVQGIVLSLQQSEVLADLRDVILPQLVSGKLRIADAAKKIAVA